MLRTGDLGSAGLVKRVAVERTLLRLWMVLVPVVALTRVEGRGGYAIVASALVLGQLASSLSAASVERTLRARLYQIAGDSLSGASGMVALPLPEAEPEIALARGIYAAARLIAARPTILGEAVALAALALVGVSLGDRSLLLPLGAGIAASGLVYLLIRKTAARLEAGLQEAGIAVFRHIVGFLSERQERIAYGLRASFLVTLSTLLARSARTELHATIARTMLRRLPVATAILVTVLTAFAVGVHDVSAASVLAISTWAQGASSLLLAYADQLRLGEEANPFFRVATLPHQGFPGTRKAPSPRTISARSVGFAYDGALAVTAASFEVTRGAPLVLRGPNGSGKSTVLRLLAGLALPTQGELSVDGIPFAELDMDAWRDSVVYLSQSPSFDPTSSVREAFTAMLPTASDEAFTRALIQVGFDEPLELLGRAIGSLSAGQRRRVHVARAIAADREVMILDEPEAGLDAAMEKRLREYLLEAAKTRLVMVATHADGYGPGCVLAAPASHRATPVEPSP